MKRLLIVIALTFALPASAAEVVSPSEFRDYSEGWTLYFERDGERWGEEQFMEGGSTLWRYKDGTCTEGAWRPYQGDICFFYYGTDDSVQCWQVLRDDDGLYARLITEGNLQRLELRITRRDRREVLCGPPAVDL